MTEDQKKELNWALANADQRDVALVQAVATLAAIVDDRLAEIAQTIREKGNFSI